MFSKIGNFQEFGTSTRCSYVRKKQWHDEVVFLDVASEKGDAWSFCTRRSSVDILGWLCDFSDSSHVKDRHSAAFLMKQSDTNKRIFGGSLNISDPSPLEIFRADSAQVLKT